MNNDLKWWPAASGGAAAVVWLGSGSLAASGFTALAALPVAAIVTALRHRKRTRAAGRERKILGRLDAEVEEYLADKAPDLTLPGGGLR